MLIDCVHGLCTNVHTGWARTDPNALCMSERPCKGMLVLAHVNGVIQLHMWGEQLILEQTRSRTVVDKCKTFWPRRSSSVTKLFCNWHKDLWGLNVLHLSTTVLLRVHSRINCSPYLLHSNEPLWHQLHVYYKVLQIVVSHICMLMGLPVIRLMTYLICMPAGCEPIGGKRCELSYRRPLRQDAAVQRVQVS